MRQEAQPPQDFRKETFPIVKYIPDIGWDRLTPPDYSSPGTQVEPGDSLEAEAEGAGGGLGGGRAGGTPPPCSAHPSPGTGSACGQGGSAGGPSRPCRTARPRSAPSRRTTGRKSAGRRPPACTPPTRAGRRGGAAHLAPCPRRDLGEAPGRTPPRAHPPHRRSWAVCPEALGHACPTPLPGFPIHSQTPQRPPTHSSAGDPETTPQGTDRLGGPGTDAGPVCWSLSGSSHSTSPTGDSRHPVPTPGQGTAPPG